MQKTEPMAGFKNYALPSDQRPKHKGVNLSAGLVCDRCGSPATYKDRPLRGMPYVCQRCLDNEKAFLSSEANTIWDQVAMAEDLYANERYAEVATLTEDLFRRVHLG